MQYKTDFRPQEHFDGVQWCEQENEKPRGQHKCELENEKPTGQHKCEQENDQAKSPAQNNKSDGEDDATSMPAVSR